MWRGNGPRALRSSICCEEPVCLLARAACAHSVRACIHASVARLRAYPRAPARMHGGASARRDAARSRVARPGCCRRSGSWRPSGTRTSSPCWSLGRGEAPPRERGAVGLARGLRDAFGDGRRVSVSGPRSASATTASCAWSLHMLEAATASLLERDVCKWRAL